MAAGENVQPGGEITPGFEIPRPTEDPYVTRLYGDHDLGATPSMRDIEPVATRLLGDPRTNLDAMALVFGREVGAQEITAESPLGQLMTSQVEPREKFAILLLMESFGLGEAANQ